MIKKFLSHESGALAQFIKYGVAGGIATAVQTIVFFILAVTLLKCLTADDWMVKLFGLPSVTISDTLRSWRALQANLIGFVVSNIICWLLNRAFVFRPGKFKWYIEFGLFFGTSSIATLLALGIQCVLIRYFSAMTTLAVLLQMVTAFMINFVVRKYVIFNH